jgi:hypothetical protein
MAAPLRIPRVRWGIGVLLGPRVLVKYFDRINLSCGAPHMLLNCYGSNILYERWARTDGCF